MAVSSLSLVASAVASILVANTRNLRETKKPFWGIFQICLQFYQIVASKAVAKSVKIIAIEVIIIALGSQ